MSRIILNDDIKAYYLLILYVNSIFDTLTITILSNLK